MNNTNFIFKIIETKEEAIEAIELYTEVQLKLNPYYVELKKNKTFDFENEIFYNYHINNINRMVTQKQCFIAIDKETNKIASLLCSEDLFGEPNPDLPEIKPLVVRMGKYVLNSQIEKFIKEGSLERVKGKYSALCKVTTHHDYMRYGLTLGLLELAEKTARELGFTHMFMDPANPIVVKYILEKLRYPELGRIYYKDIEFEGSYPYECGFKEGFSSDAFYCFVIKSLE
jgi:hypothetical protein